MNKQLCLLGLHFFLPLMCVCLYSGNRPTLIYNSNCRCEGAGGRPEARSEGCPTAVDGEADDEVRRPAYEALGGLGVVRGLSLPSFAAA